MRRKHFRKRFRKRKVIIRRIVHRHKGKQRRHDLHKQDGKITHKQWNSSVMQPDNHKVGF